MYCKNLRAKSERQGQLQDIKFDRWLKANKLSLNVAKTEFMVISSRQKLQSLNDYRMNIHIDSVPIILSNQSS